MIIPTTRAGINALITKMRRHREHLERIPTDAEIRQRGGPNRFGHFTYSRSWISIDSFNHRALVEMQSPLMTVNNTDDPGADYPEFSFSSRALTDWYMSEFCRINHLKETT
jgi:hypothetical protein